MAGGSRGFRQQVTREEAGRHEAASRETRMGLERPGRPSGGPQTQGLFLRAQALRYLLVAAGPVVSVTLTLQGGSECLH